MKKCKVTEVYELLEKGYKVFTPFGDEVIISGYTLEFLGEPGEAVYFTRHLIKEDWSYEEPGYDFIEVIKLAKDKAIKRIIWNNGHYYKKDKESGSLLIYNSWFLFDKNGEKSELQLETEDILAKDWIILGE